jgi:hypothetical protein
VEKTKNLFERITNFLIILSDFFAPDLGRCPNCLSNNYEVIDIIPNYIRDPLDAIFLASCDSISLPSGKKLRCKECGSEWIE